MYEMLFIKLIKSHALLYSIIISGNISLALNDSTAIERYPGVYGIAPFQLTEDIHFDECVITADKVANEYVNFDFKTRDLRIFDERAIFFGYTDDRRVKSYNIGGYTTAIESLEGMQKSVSGQK